MYLSQPRYAVVIGDSTNALTLNEHQSVPEEEKRRFDLGIGSPLSINLSHLEY